MTDRPGLCRRQRASASGTVVLAQVMLPADANSTGDVHGGTLMKLADTAGGIAAVRHARRRVVTAIADSMTFEYPVKVGDLVLLDAEVSWVGGPASRSRSPSPPRRS